MFIEFETDSGHTMLSVRHIVQVKKSKLGDSQTEIILANGGLITVGGSYEDVCDSITRMVEDIGN